MDTLHPCKDVRRRCAEFRKPRAIGAATDRYFRAFDAATGEEIWRTRIPANANSVPMTYRLREDSRQFVVVAAGGNPLGGMGDSLIAYALPGD